MRTEIGGERKLIFLPNLIRPIRTEIHPTLYSHHSDETLTPYKRNPHPLQTPPPIFLVAAARVAATADLCCCRRSQGGDMMEDDGNKSFLESMLSHLRSTCKYYTGYPKDLGPSRVIHFTSERQFVQLLHEGSPVVVAFTIRSPYTKHLDGVLEEAAAKFYPNFKFVRVECPKYPGFCIARQKNDYPFIEIFHSPGQAASASHGKVVDPNVTKYTVKVLPFNYDVSVYGFREFFKRHGILVEDSSNATREGPR